jgi:hypothetical protein
VAGGTGSDFILQDQEKEYFLELLERFSSGFFVRIHAFAIMSNHFHILATGMELKAKKASKKELLSRYKLLYPKESEPPPGRQIFACPRIFILLSSFARSSLY